MQTLVEAVAYREKTREEQHIKSMVLTTRACDGE
jgi:hypothetical protein